MQQSQRCYERLECVDVTKLDEEQRQRVTTGTLMPLENVVRSSNLLYRRIVPCPEAETALERIGQLEDLKEWSL